LEGKKLTTQNFSPFNSSSPNNNDQDTLRRNLQYLSDEVQSSGNLRNYTEKPNANTSLLSDRPTAYSSGQLFPMENEQNPLLGHLTASTWGLKNKACASPQMQAPRY